MMIRNRLRRRLAALCLLSAVAFAGAQGAWAVDPSLLLVPPSGSVSEEDAECAKSAYRTEDTRRLRR